jgi:hypothetical protein
LLQVCRIHQRADEGRSFFDSLRGRPLLLQWPGKSMASTFQP